MNLCKVHCTLLAPRPMDIHIINLARSLDRREFIRGQLAGLGIPHTFFDASDARCPEFPKHNRYDEALALKRTGQTLAPGECGCFASHHRLWQMCAESGRPLVVMEDDVVVSPSLAEAIEDAAKHIHARRFIRLCGLWDCRHDTVMPLSGERRLVRYRKGPVGTQCYAISPRGARALLRHAERWVEPVDRYIDRFWLHGVQSYAIHPFPVSLPAEELASVIESGRAETRNKSAQRWHKWNNRIGRFRANLVYRLHGDRAHAGAADLQ